MIPVKPVKIRIRNYQAVEDVELEVRGFTCVTGRTNIGKSSIVRAVSGAILNAPAVGKVRHGHKYATVDMESEGWGFRWEKGESVSRYWLPGEDKPKTALGQGQTEHTVAMGFRSVRVGQDNIHPWFASQHEPIFLLDQSGPSVTEFISEVSRLKVLQDAIGINVRAKESLLREAKLDDKMAEEARALLQPFEALASLQGVPESLEAQLESIEEYQARVALGEKLEADIEATKASLGLLEGVDGLRIKAGPEADVESMARAASMLGDLEAAAVKVIAVRPVDSVAVPEAPDMSQLFLAATALEAEAARADIEAMDRILAAASTSDGPSEDIRRLQEASTVLRPLEEAKASLGAVSAAEDIALPLGPDEIAKLEEVVRLLQDLEETARQVAFSQSELGSVEKELSQVMEELGSIPTCPTCNQVMPSDPPGADRRHSP